jgi:hypothetical protein
VAPSPQASNYRAATPSRVPRGRLNGSAATTAGGRANLLRCGLAVGPIPTSGSERPAAKWRVQPSPLRSLDSGGVENQQGDGRWRRGKLL